MTHSVYFLFLSNLPQQDLFKTIAQLQTYAVPQKYLKYNSSANALFGK